MLMAIHDRAGENRLVMTDAQGRILETLASYGESIAFNWSPDGTKVAFIASDRGRQGVSGPLTVMDRQPDELSHRRAAGPCLFWAPTAADRLLSQVLGMDETQTEQIYGLGLHFWM
jgi:hypothetical protein